MVLLLQIYQCLLYDSIISEAGHGVNRDAAPLMERVDGVVVAADALGHTFGVRVLKMDRPDGRKVLKFDGPSGRGLWYRPLGAQRTHFEGALATRKM